MNFKFKNDFTFGQRIEESERVKKDNPGKIPIICERDLRSKLGQLEKTKYLIDNLSSLEVLTNNIKKKLNIGEEEALFFYANGKIPLVGNKNTIEEIYEKYRDDDGFLYLSCTNEVFEKDCHCCCISF